MKKFNRIWTVLFLSTTILFAILFAWKACEAERPAASTQPAAAETVNGTFDNTPESADGFHDNYQLEKVVVLSRHNIRSPLSTNGSALAQLTPYEWFDWTSGPSDLSLRGGDCETMMGQYFRKWMEADGLFTENEVPTDGQVRFYANSMQRTIATSQYFSSGMFPVANLSIEHHEELNTMDPTFTPQLTYVSDAYNQEVMKQISAMGGEDGLQGIGKQLSDNYQLLADVIDLKDSQAAQNGMSEFSTDDLNIVLKANAEPGMTGSLKSANQASDALILQYYEESDATEAAFGHTLTYDQWKEIAKIKDVYGDVLFSAPAVAVNVAHPLLQEMQKEMALDDRKFTFLCGHDSNIESVLCALNAEDYELPETIERKTPIGVKLVIQKWLGKDQKEYASLCLVYQSTDQLRTRSMLTLDNPPMMYQIELNGLQKNEAGLYLYSDLQQRFQESIDAYDALSSLS